MRIYLALVAVLAACSAQPKNEAQVASEQGIKPAADPGAIANVSYDGPFGIARGEPLNALGEAKANGPGLYKLATVPQPYPNIEFYMVQNTPQNGTCMVKAISDDIETDSFGGKVRSAVDHVRDDLAARYGAPTKSFDFLTAGSIWNDPQDWMMGLAKDERHYSYYWQVPQKANPKIWRGVEVVGLSAGSNGQKGWFTIEYDFSGNEKCDDDLKHKAAQAL